MKPDSFTRTEQAAGEHAELLGRIEDFGASDDDSVPTGGIPRLGPDPWHDPPPTPREWPPIPTDPPF